MRNAISILIVSITMLALAPADTRAAYMVYAPDYPTLTQLESGWNTAFVSWLTDKYGESPTITSTTTYAGQDGQIFVMSSFTAGGTSGKILGRAFDPQEATPLGSGAYHYQVQENGGFTCSSANCLCDPHERHYPDGSYERWCDCTYKGDCTLTPISNLVGSYKISPTDYSNLPTLN